MTETVFSRKLDATGRIMIPIKLREQMGLTAGQEYYFLTAEEGGRKYICIDCGPTISNAELDRALQIIQASGMKVVSSQPE